MQLLTYSRMKTVIVIRLWETLSVVARL